MDDHSLSTRARATLNQSAAGQAGIQPPVRRTPRQYQPASSGPAASFQTNTAGGLSAQVQQQVAQRPWVALGIALAAGYTLGNMTGGDEETSTHNAAARSYIAQAPLAGSSQREQGGPAAYTPANTLPSDKPAYQRPGPYSAASAPAKPGLLSQLTSQFDDQFTEIKDTAVTTVLGLVRDTIKQNVPALHQELERVRAERGQPSSTSNPQTVGAASDSFATNRGDL